jgi:hypothetical protein
MVASPTTKKSHEVLSKKQLEQVDQMIDIALGYIRHWKHKQLNQLHRHGHMIILPGSRKNEFTIGKYRMLGYNANCWTVWNHNNDRVHDFYDRRAAVFYCIAIQKNQFRDAQALLLADTEIGKLSMDRVFYERRLSQARREKNWMIYDVITARLTDTLIRLEPAQEQFEKNLRWAKYLKTQDTPYETTRTRN